jgi:hypothetical protein
MKTPTVGLFAVALLVSFAVSARADINFNFDTTYRDYPYYDNGTDPSNVTLQTTDVVGVVPESGWYNSPDIAQYGSGQYLYTVPTMSLTDSTGAPTGATLTLTPSQGQFGLNGIQVLAEQGSWDSSATSDAALTVTDKMFNSTITAGGGRTAEFNLQNVPYLQYNLIVYLTFSQYQLGSLQLFEGGVVGGAQTPLQFGTGLGWVPLNQYGGYPDSGYTQITSTDSSNPTLTGNTGAYVEFTGLTNPDQTLDFVGQGGIAGFQIIDEAPVPEPSTWAMIALGVVGLAGWRRLRTAK